MNIFQAIEVEKIYEIPKVGSRDLEITESRK